MHGKGYLLKKVVEKKLLSGFTIKIENDDDLKRFYSAYVILKGEFNNSLLNCGRHRLRQSSSGCLHATFIVSSLDEYVLDSYKRYTYDGTIQVSLDTFENEIVPYERGDK